MKKKKWLIIGAVVLVVLVGGFFIVRQMLPSLPSGDAPGFVRDCTPGTWAVDYYDRRHRLSPFGAERYGRLAGQRRSGTD